ncbi:MAG: hypothetical protein K2P28_09920 [Lachnospiraceae bacterium]|jgi:hypothetical protein|nr:hypothetical protein [Lachnospiraceae bacterium]
MGRYDITAEAVSKLLGIHRFYRLIVVCDDYGRFDGRPAIIKGACFPLKEPSCN